MSLFSPRSVLAVVGTMLALIALYLLLEWGTNTTQILGSLAGGAIGTIGALQGRNVSGGAFSVS